MPVTNNRPPAFGQLNPDFIRGQIDSGMSYVVLWEKGLTCPRRVEDADNHDINCSLCEGTGFLYVDPIETKAIVSSISLHQMYQSFGRFDAGMAQISLPSGLKPSWWDRITLVEATVRYNEPVLRDATSLCKLRYDITAPLDAETGVLTIVDSNGSVYDATTYTVPNGKLVWVDGAGPAEGTYYTVSYFVKPRYVILDLTHQVRLFSTDRTGSEAQPKSEFPVQCVGKLEFIPRENNPP